MWIRKKRLREFVDVVKHPPLFESVTEKGLWYKKQAKKILGLELK